MSRRVLMRNRIREANNDKRGISECLPGYLPPPPGKYKVLWEPEKRPASADRYFEMQVRSKR